MSKDDRDNKVHEILATATEALGPTEIARRIGEDWCGGGKFGYPLSSTIVPILRRIGAIKAEGQFGKYIMGANAIVSGLPRKGEAK